MAGSARGRFVTLPNFLSLVRLLSPLALPVLARPGRWGAAGLLVAGAALTDWMDGHLARRLRQVSEVGKVLDPAADRFFALGCLIALVLGGGLPPLAAGALVVRESGLVLAFPLLALLGVPRIEVSAVGKAGTALVMSAFAFLFAGLATGAPALRTVGLALFYLGLVVAYAAAAGYALEASRRVRGIRRHKAERHKTDALK